MECIEVISIGQVALDIVGVTEQRDLPPGTAVRLRSVRYMLGGAAANFAISSKVLGKRRAAVMSKVGSDALSSAMKMRIEELGIKTFIDVVDGPPHIVVSVVRPDGGRTLIGAMNENLLLSVEDVEKKLDALYGDCIRSVHMSYIRPDIVSKVLKILRERNDDVVVTYKPGIYMKGLISEGRFLEVDLIQSTLTDIQLPELTGFDTLLLEHDRGFSLYINGEEVSRVILSSRDRTGSGDIYTGLLVSKFLYHHDWLAAFEETAEIIQRVDSPWLLGERILFDRNGEIQ